MKARLRAFALEHRTALLVLALLLLERLLGIYTLGVTYSLQSDDLSYVNSGITFASTGMVTMHDGQHPSAQIMPGMRVLIGLFSLVFGEGRLLWAALKLFWVAMGTLTAWFVYRSVRLFAPAWCGVAAMLPFFRADIVWMDNLILTETPFMLALTAMVYYTMRMAKKPDWRSFWCCLIAYMLSLQCKANIAPYPLLALLYLLLMKYDRKLLLRQCGVLAGAVLCFLVPWTIRNYVHFHDFIPLTYGAGNPSLLGTYQGTGYPLDEELDYETNVNQVVREKYARYLQEDGTPQPAFQRYVNLQRDAVKAKYRQQVWRQENPQSMLYSYLVLKPWRLIADVFYWETVFDVKLEWIRLAQWIDLCLCVLAFIAAHVLKQNRKQAWLLAGTYFANVFIYSMTYVFGRYNASLMSLRFILAGIGLGLLFQLVKRGIRTIKTVK